MRYLNGTDRGGCFEVGGGRSLEDPGATTPRPSSPGEKVEMDFLRDPILKTQTGRMANMNDEHGGPIFRYVDRAVRSHEQHDEITRRQAERDAHNEPRWKILVVEHPTRPRLLPGPAGGGGRG
jgi:hypothetical protein